jgi:hypothetical protein
VEFRETVQIDAGPAEVAAVLRDVERWPTWTASMTHVRRHGTGPLAVGELVDVKQPRLPASTWTVSTLDGSGFRWTSSTPGVHSVGDHWAHDSGDGGTTVTLALTLTGPLARLTTLFYSGLIRRYVRMEADGLRAEVARRASGR